ncbi:MAG: hypothetical protein HKN46_10525, partial [Acidimicrobiia bacterium]|nr:hypothetical protein [Acidimicrobiia bacterium]
IFGDGPVTVADPEATVYADIDDVVDDKVPPPVKDDPPVATEAPAKDSASVVATPVFEVVILTPADGATIAEPVAAVFGEASEGVEVSVNGVPAVHDGSGHWVAEVPLVQGKNLLDARGYVGGDKVARDVVELQYVPISAEPTPTTTKPTPTTTKATTPVVDHGVWIISPKHGSELDGSTVVVSGESTTSPVYVNGVKATFSDADHWSATVPLKAGWNLIEAKAYVGDTKVARQSIEVWAGTPPTDYAISISSPANGSEHDESTILVTGEATPGTTVYVHGVQATFSSDTNWSAMVNLTPGWNTIWAKAYVGDVKVAKTSIEVVHLFAAEVAITSPPDGTEILEGESVLVTGEFAGDVTIYVNGIQAAVDGSQWSAVVPLSAGWNLIKAKAYVGDVKVAYDAIEVHLGEVIVVPFTVTQMYGECELDPPYETFYGTATPNGKVWIQSPYGEKTVYADAAGNWEATIYFEGVPSGKTFEISVKDYEKHEYQYFSFTYTG